MEGLKEGLVIPGFLFVDEPYKALPLTAKVVLGLLIGCMRPDKEAAGEMVVCIKQDDIGAILNISRHTYRRALQSLAGCGLIEVTRGTGGHTNIVRFPVYQNLPLNTSNGWKVGKNPMKDWKAAVRTWAKRDGNSQGNRRPMNGNERLKQSDDELERMCRAYDSRNGATSVDYPTRKLP